MVGRSGAQRNGIHARKVARCADWMRELTQRKTHQADGIRALWQTSAADESLASMPEHANETSQMEDPDRNVFKRLG